MDRLDCARRALIDRSLAGAAATAATRRREAQRGTVKLRNIACGRADRRPRLVHTQPCQAMNFGLGAPMVHRLTVSNSGRIAEVFGHTADQPGVGRSGFTQFQ